MANAAVDRPWLSLYGVRLGSRKPDDAPDTPGSDVSEVGGVGEEVGVGGAARADASVRSQVGEGRSRPRRGPRAGPVESIPPDVLLAILARLPSASLARAQCVSVRWRDVASAPSLWRARCAAEMGKDLATSASAEVLEGAGEPTAAPSLAPAPPAPGVFAATRGAAERQAATRRAEVEAELASMQFYGGIWKRLLYTTPHPRLDGLYVSRNTYLKPGAPDWRQGKPVHVVCYFRYLLFSAPGPGGVGDAWYATSPTPPAKVAPELRRAADRASTARAAGGWAGGPGDAGAPPPAPQTAWGERRGGGLGVLGGRYRLSGAAVFAALPYRDAAGTQLRARLGLRSATAGAHDRLDVRRLYSYDSRDRTESPLPAGEAEGLVDEEGARGYGRGLATFVFVPWDRVVATPLNLPIEQMDFFLPG